MTTAVERRRGRARALARGPPGGCHHAAVRGRRRHLRIVSDGARPATLHRAALRRRHGLGAGRRTVPGRRDGPAARGVVALRHARLGRGGLRGDRRDGPGRVRRAGRHRARDEPRARGAGDGHRRLAAVDDATGTGVARTEHRVDGGPVTGTPARSPSPGGQHVVEYRSADRAGNVEPFRRLVLLSRTRRHAAAAGGGHASPPRRRGERPRPPARRASACSVRSAAASRSAASPAAGCGCGSSLRAGRGRPDRPACPRPDPRPAGRGVRRPPRAAAAAAQGRPPGAAPGGPPGPGRRSASARPARPLTRPGDVAMIARLLPRSRRPRAGGGSSSPPGCCSRSRWRRSSRGSRTRPRTRTRPSCRTRRSRRRSTT